MSAHSVIFECVTPRAAALSADQRREALVQATLPLLVEYGRFVTTRMIAEAAGVAEAAEAGIATAFVDSRVTGYFTQALSTGRNALCLTASELAAFVQAQPAKGGSDAQRQAIDYAELERALDQIEPGLSHRSGDGTREPHAYRAP